MYECSIEIELHSKDAKILFAGGQKTKEFIPSFFYTQKRLNALYAMAMSDNPFAIGVLIELDRRFDDINHYADSLVNKSKALIDRSCDDGIIINVIKDKSPERITIDYATEYTQQLARIMAKVDLTFRHLLSLHTAGLMTEEYTIDSMRSLRKRVRRIFDTIVTKTKKIRPDITRKDISSNSEKAKAMIKLMGVPHNDIVNGSLTFRHRRISSLAS